MAADNSQDYRINADCYTRQKKQQTLTDDDLPTISEEWKTHARLMLCDIFKGTWLMSSQEFPFYQNRAIPTISIQNNLLYCITNVTNSISRGLGSNIAISQPTCQLRM